MTDPHEVLGKAEPQSPSTPAEASTPPTHIESVLADLDRFIATLGNSALVSESPVKINATKLKPDKMRAAIELLNRDRITAENPQPDAGDDQGVLPAQPVTSSAPAKKVVLAKKTKPAKKPTVAPASQEQGLETGLRWAGKLVRRGKLVVPQYDLQPDNLATKLMRIYNEDELNETTRESIKGLKIEAQDATIEANGEIYFDGKYMPLDKYLTRLVNELFLGYMYETLDVETIFSRCGFGEADRTEQEVRLGKQKLHDTLLVLKRLKIVTYDDASRNQISLMPMIFHEERKK